LKKINGFYNYSSFQAIKMKKQTSFSTQGQRADLGPLHIQRMLPNRYADAVGPFVFLDHQPSKKLSIKMEWVLILTEVSQL
jgi:hypothetical protein